MQTTLENNRTNFVLKYQSCSEKLRFLSGDGF